MLRVVAAMAVLSVGGVGASETAATGRGEEALVAATVTPTRSSVASPVGVMQAAGRALRNLRYSDLDAASRDADLEEIGAIQLAMVRAKGMAGVVRAAHPSPTGPPEQFEAAYRRAILGVIEETLVLEEAVLVGDRAGAMRSLERLRGLQREGHARFDPERDDE